MSIPWKIGEHDIDWEHSRSQLDDRGFMLISGVLAKQTCEEVAGYYADDQRFRSRIEMSRYSFGRGEYKYFNYPLPEIVKNLRAWIYPQLAPLANQWAERLSSKTPRYPEKLTDFLEQCHRAGQKRATPLLLKYGAGDFNCLHQDLYGEIAFPSAAREATTEPTFVTASAPFTRASDIRWELFSTTPSRTTESGSIGLLSCTHCKISPKFISSFPLEFVV